MQIEEHGAVTRVILTDHTGFRAKLLFSFEALALIGGIVAMVYAMGDALTHERDFGFSFFFPLGIAIVFGIAFWRYASRVMQREELFIRPDIITLISIKGGRKSVVDYPVAQITRLHYIGFEKTIDHPLKSESFDYLGFQTQQEVVNSVMAEGNIGFEYEGRKIRFGIGVPSWDASILSELLMKETQGELSITDLPEEIPEGEWKQ